jgi:hypothetical protein
MAVTAAAAAAIVLTAGVLTACGRGPAGPPSGVSLAGAAGSEPAPASRTLSETQDLRAFLTWAVTSGMAQLATVHFQPLPPSVITLSDAQIARIRG